MPQSVEYWATHRPDAPAIHEADQVLTWREWNDRADKVAEGLAARGIQAGDVVAARTQIRTEWAILATALGKLGCSLLGLNWRLTPAEVRFVLSNSGATVMVCDDADPAPLVDSLADLGLKLVVSIDREVEGAVNWADLEAAQGPPRIATQEAALIIYTSGTTGLPKGVVMAPRDPSKVQEMSEYAASMESRISRQAEDVVLVTMPFSHGAGPGLVRGSIRAGNAMVFMRRFDPEQALKLIARHGVTFWVSVPTMLKRIASLPLETIKSHRTDTLRIIQTGAAPVPHALKEWVAEVFGPNVLNETYGSTETGMISQIGPEMLQLKPGSSGKPYAHVHISVRNSDGHVLPTGTAGELWVHTPFVISGYLNAPTLDEDTLDADGFFRTGDVGYLDRDGYLFITDRAKDMIISGGVNLYPAEIEAALQQHPDVQDVAVIGIPDEEFGEQVKAFVEVKPGAQLGEADLRAFAAQTLASYKRPKTFEFVPELPRNVMGKVLKNDLRAPYWAGRERKV
jgi:long-chain acyl-CoA synthetase